jgi:PAS domain S-box-containing protein
VLALAPERLAAGRGAMLAVRGRHRDGRELRVGISAVDRRDVPELGAIVATLRDITEPGLREEELARARDFYLTLLDRFPSPMWRSTSPLGVDWVNRAYVEFTGRSVEEELGEGWTEVVHPNDLEGLLDVFARTFEDREPFVLEYRIRHRSGEYRWVVDHGQPIIGLGGEFLGHIGAFYDVHDRIRTEEVLRATVEDLRADLAALARVADERREAIARLLQDEERRARELADQIENDQLQALAALKLRVELLGEQLREDPVVSSLGPVMRSVEETMTRMRRLMRELREEEGEARP